MRESPLPAGFSSCVTPQLFPTWVPKFLLLLLLFLSAGESTAGEEMNGRCGPSACCGPGCAPLCSQRGRCAVLPLQRRRFIVTWGGRHPARQDQGLKREATPGWARLQFLACRKIFRFRWGLRQAFFPFGRRVVAHLMENRYLTPLRIGGTGSLQWSKKVPRQD